MFFFNYYYFVRTYQTGESSIVWEFKWNVVISTQNILLSISKFFALFTDFPLSCNRVQQLLKRSVAKQIRNLQTALFPIKLQCSIKLPLPPPLKKKIQNENLCNLCFPGYVLSCHSPLSDSWSLSSVITDSERMKTPYVIKHILLTE